MAPTSSELELGAKAYQQVRIYEKYTQRNLRLAPWIAAACAALFLIVVLLFHHNRHEWPQSTMMMIVFPVCVAIHWGQSRTARALYTSNKLILQLLQEKHGDTLPWLVEERELAQANALEKDMAREQQMPSPV